VHVFRACPPFLRLVLPLLASAVLAAPAPAAEPELKRLDTYVASDPVNTLLPVRGRLFVGGDFTRIGPDTGPAAVLDPETGGLGPFPYVIGSVRAAVPDGSGGWYLAGFNLHAGDVTGTSVLHVFANGDVDRLFIAASDGPIHTLALLDGRLYAGGFFSSVGGRSRRNLAALDPRTGAADPAFDPSVNGTVESIGVGNGRVYVGGTFERVGETSRSNLAAVDSKTGAVVPGFASGANGEVKTLDVSGGRLFVGGGFSAVGGKSRNRLAALDSTTGEVLAGFDPNPNGEVARVLAAGGRVYVGGRFTMIAGADQPRLAALDEQTGEFASGFAPKLDEAPSSLASTSGRLYAGGYGGLVAVDATTGATIPTFDPGPFGGNVEALATDGARLFAGGSFGSIGSTRRRGIAALDPSSGKLLQDFTPDVPGDVGQIAAYRGRLYIAGTFRRAGGLWRRGLVAIRASDGALVREFRPPSIASGAVILVHRSRLYVARGVFPRRTRSLRVTILSPRTGRRLGRFNVRLGPAAGERKSLTVHAVAARGRRLYLGGSFGRVNGTRRFSAAAVNARTGRLDRRFRPRLRGAGDPAYITNLAVSRSRVYFGGDIARIGKLRRRTFGAVDRRSGQPIRRFRPPRLAPYGQPTGPILAGKRLVVADDTTVLLLRARSGRVLASTTFYETEGDISALAVASGRLYVGGDLTAGDLARDPNGGANHLAAFDLGG
jgi:putative pyrroloquinoline-quinone binding quinoprotein/beta-propeller uncharacterized protein DUF5122